MSPSFAAPAVGLVALGLASCSGPACPEGSLEREGRCVALDGAIADGGTDSGADAGECGGRCTGTTPVCDVTNGECVECLDRTHCAASARGPACVSMRCAECGADGDCAGATPRCDVGANTCVQCIAPTDCTSATASRCVSGACGACVADADCAHLAGLGVCDAGTCVECTASDETACGANVCDVAARSCSDRVAGSGTSCGRTTVGTTTTARECLSDRECPAGLACVLTRFDEPPVGDVLIDIGYYCLPLADATCTPLTAPYVDRQMLRNRAGDLVAVCALRVATCPAYVAFGSTECADADECGVPRVDDALCRPGAPTGTACTTRCVGPEDCDTGLACSSTAPRYCCFSGTCS